MISLHRLYVSTLCVCMYACMHATTCSPTFDLELVRLRTKNCTNHHHHYHLLHNCRAVELFLHNINLSFTRQRHTYACRRLAAQQQTGIFATKIWWLHFRFIYHGGEVKFYTNYIIFARESSYKLKYFMRQRTASACECLCRILWFIMR